MAAELLQATGGRMERMEQTMHMTEMQMSSSSGFTSSMASSKLRKVVQGLTRTVEGRNASLSAFLSPVTQIIVY